MSAYKHGPHDNIKYSAKPVPCEGQKEMPPVPGSRWARNALRDTLVKQLNPQSGNPACFDLMVQLQHPEKNMPVEDTTVEWKEKDSPFVPVARISIGKQRVDEPARDAFCENLSMTPWHALADHRPLGGLNRVRKAVYQHVARYRRCQNGAAFGEPKLDGSLAFDSQPCRPTEPVPAVSPAAPVRSGP
jgi:hypothetical protein